MLRGIYWSVSRQSQMLIVFGVGEVCRCSLWKQRLLAPVIYGKPRNRIVIVGPIKNVVDVVFVRLILKASCLGSIYSSPNIP